VKEFVASCDVYVRAKNSRHRFHGLFQPLSILTFPQFSISMEFITNLPPFNSFESILVVDHLMKMAHFILCTKAITSEGIAMLFLDHGFRYHGLSKNITFYCGLQFASKFWK